VASETGEEYNIEPCVFSVPGLRNFSPPQLYYDIFGRSFSNMEGGRKDIAHKITQEGLGNARKQLLGIAHKEIKTALENEAGPDFQILENGIELEFIEGKALNAKEGQEIDVFIYEIKVRATGFKVQNSFLFEFAKEYLVSNLVASKDFIEELLMVRFLPKEENQIPIKEMVTEPVTKTIQISVRLDSDLHQELKAVSYETNKSIQNIFMESLRPYLKSQIKYQSFATRLTPGNINKLEYLSKSTGESKQDVLNNLIKNDK